MRWVYLSPHFDDVALSCGGLLWEQAQAGQSAEVWTICAGEPAPGEPLSDFAQQLHQRWQTGPQAVDARRVEDACAVRLLNAQPRFWDLPDCIYRRLPDGPGGAPGSWLVNGEEDLWQPVHPLEAHLVTQLSTWVSAQLSPQDVLVSPLTLGNHVDHNLVRAAAEDAAAQSGCELLYYMDYPYAVRPGSDQSSMPGPEWRQVCREISTSGLRAWQEAVACYTSQLSTFWNGRAGLDADLVAYWQSGGGACLWQPQPASASKNFS
jgi:LmbE family N-acetylglucosaminyl deacetylase